MKNKKNIILTVLFISLTFLSVQSGWCSNESQPPSTVQTNSAPQSSTIPMKKDSMKDILTKFGITMGGVFISLLVIWIGLNIFKNYKFKTKVTNQKAINTGLKTPENIDDAIVSFINQNRLT